MAKRGSSTRNIYSNATVTVMEPTIRVVVGGPTATQAMRELREWRNSYGSIVDLGPVFMLVDKALKLRRRKAHMSDADQTSSRGLSLGNRSPGKFDGPR